MPRQYVVKQGDCLYSIAAQHGMNWEDLWNAPENESLRRTRSKPEVLYQGDKVNIPDKRDRQESGGTEERHKFVLKGRPVMLRVRFLDEGKPRSGEPYVLKVDKRIFSGETDENGGVEHEIPPTATIATLRLGPPDGGEDYILHLGGLDPVDEVSGVQGRLHNLGYNVGEMDGIMGPVTGDAIREFQRDNNLEATGKVDRPTKEKLVERHRS